MTRLGIIAEDVSDVEVIKCLGRKISGRPISTRHFTGKGCGAIQRKAVGWCNDLHRKGCNKVLIIHDQDKNDRKSLQQKLEAIFKPCPQAVKIIIIPCEELEAWLLSDIDAIKKTFNITKKIKEIHKPESISSPKEYIESLVWRASDKTKRYINSIHNHLIAEVINIDQVHSKCKSFNELYDFFE